MSNWPLLLIALITFIPLSLILSVIPALTRRTESFGVSLED